MTIPSPAPGGGVYTALDPWGRPSAVTYYTPPAVVLRVAAGGSVTLTSRSRAHLGRVR